MMIALKTLLFVVLLLPKQVTPFVVPNTVTTHRTINTQRHSTEGDLRSEAERLMNRARELRASLPAEETKEAVTVDVAMATSEVESKWAVQQNSPDGVGYRLELDIGREDGTWMDPRWGASGKRIELTLDVLFSSVGATAEEQEKMVKDNFGGTSSSVSLLETAQVARLRSGFDQMKCGGGAYRVDSSNAGQTCRFYINVDGTPQKGSSYGDVFVPQGCLYVSLACFGSASQLSTREGIVTVRQMGWHTGLRREESRIIGVVRATPIEKAKRRDGF